MANAKPGAYCGRHRGKRRGAERVTAPQKLAFVDVVTSSHNHTDHLDAETLRPILSADPKTKLVIPEADRAFVAERLRIDPTFPIGLSIGETKTVGEMTVTAVPAAHEQLEPGCVGYVVRLGPWTIYHSGDTLVYDGMADRLRAYAIDVAILPINGKVGNMSGVEAAGLAKAVGAKVAIPCHYEMFAFNTASPAAFAAECGRLGQEFRVLKNGQRTSLAAARCAKPNDSR